MISKSWAPIGRGNASALADRARELEDRGYAGVIGNQVYGPPWAPLGVAATATTRLGLESGIAMSFVRSPFETACAALELDQISDGRFTLGLGTAPQTWTEDYFDAEFESPIARLREVVEIIRLVNDAAASGADHLPSYRGRFHELTFDGLHPNFGEGVRRVPIYIAALRERLCELAGEIADGFIGHSIWSSWWLRDRVLPAVERGARQAGRAVEDLHMQLWLTAVVDETTEAAARTARANMAFYASIPSYRNYFDAHGFGDVFDRLVDARRSLPLTECLDLVPLEAARTFAVCGTEDEVGQQIEELAAVADSLCIKPPMWGLEPAEFAAQSQAIERILLG